MDHIIETAYELREFAQHNHDCVAFVTQELKDLYDHNSGILQANFNLAIAKFLINNHNIDIVVANA